MADMSEVDPDLVGPAGLELAGQQRGDRLAVLTAESFSHFIMRDGLAAALAHRHLLTRMGMTIDRSVDQRAARMSRGRMHHEAGRLVDDDDVLVLVDDVERDILSLRGGIGGFRHVDYDRITGADMISGVADGDGSGRLFLD